MIYRLDVKPDAREELALAAIYYETLAEGLGVKFINAWEITTSVIQKNPVGFAIKKQNFRQALIPKFPYLIVFEVLDKTVVIYAIIHAKKHSAKRYKKKN